MKEIKPEAEVKETLPAKPDEEALRELVREIPEAARMEMEPA